jgi:hypothetical protein
VWQVLENAGGDRASAAMLEAIKGGVASQDATATTARLIEDQFDAVGEAATRLSAIQGQAVLFFTAGFESKLVHGDANLMGRMTDMHKRFRAAGVILDSIDVAGLRTRSTISNDGLWVLRADGRAVVVNRNDLTTGITDLTTAQQFVYLLGIRRTDNREHRIDVRVSGAPPRSNIYYRTGFGAPQRRDRCAAARRHRVE